MLRRFSKDAALLDDIGVGRRSDATREPGPLKCCAFRTDPPLPVGVIRNRRAHRNKPDSGKSCIPEGEAYFAEPATRAELEFALALFRRRGLGTIVVDGGDGTVRDVLTLLSGYYGVDLPRLIVVPSGKTNALAYDLGIPASFDLAAALAMIPSMRLVRRAPLEIRYLDGAHEDLRGFLFGTGAFVRATHLAQRFHKIGAFRGLAVGFALGTGLMQSVFARDTNPWRRGEEMIVHRDHVPACEQRRYLFLASTLQCLPPGIMPFGRGQSGMRILDVAAPPRRLALAVPVLLTGRYPTRFVDWGYRQCASEVVRLSLPAGFVLDGEAYPGGDVSIMPGRTMDFLVP